MRNKVMKNIKDYLKKAREEKWAVGHFNFSNLETLRAIVNAAKNLRAPVAIGTSEGESNFIGSEQAVALIRSFREEYGLPMFLNLDHGKSLEYIRVVVEAGYDAVHFDGSALPLSKNISQTKKVIALAQKKKILVEGEVGIIGGELTKPEEAEQFVKETKVDSLAINIGTFHGAGEKNINIRQLKEIKDRIGDKAFLVMHGGSGTTEEDVAEAIKSGINIVHVNTELRIAFTNTLRNVLAENPRELVPYKYMPKVVEAIQKIVEKKIMLFGSVNRI